MAECHDEKIAKTVADLMVEQVEFADVIILNKISLVEEADLNSLRWVRVTFGHIVLLTSPISSCYLKLQNRALVQRLNPAAHLYANDYTCVDLDTILDTGLFSLEKAE